MITVLHRGGYAQMTTILHVICARPLTRPSTRHLLPKNFEKTALRKRLGIFTVKMRGGHIYGNYCTAICKTIGFQWKD